MYQGPPATSAWNGNELAEHFIYEGEVHPATAQQQTMEDEAKKEDEENLVHVDTVAEETEEEESVRIPAWQNPNTKRCARQAVALLNQVVLDAMPTDNLTWIMQAGFQSLMLRCVRHWVSLSLMINSLFHWGGGSDIRFIKNECREPELNQRPLDLQSNALPNYAITAYKYNNDIGIISIEYSGPGRSENQKVCLAAGWWR